MSGVVSLILIGFKLLESNQSVLSLGRDSVTDSLGIVVDGLGSNDSGLEAFFHHFTIVIEEKESPETDSVA